MSLPRQPGLGRNQEVSYEGQTEYLCPNGHFWSHDIWANIKAHLREICPHCNQHAEWCCHVDLTNGPSDCAWTLSGPKRKIGFVDEERYDHLGNRYYYRLDRFQPVLDTNRWIAVKPSDLPLKPDCHTQP